MTIDEKIREIRQTRDVEVALRAIRDKERAIRLAGYITLIEMRESITVPEIVVAYNSELDDKVRGAALITIGVCSEIKRMDLFQPVLDDQHSSSTMIAAAYIAMCENGYEHKVEEAITSNPSTRHREIAAKVIEDVRAERRERMEKIFPGLAP